MKVLLFAAAALATLSCSKAPDPADSAGPPPESPEPPRDPAASEMEYAIVVPGRPDYVKSPYAPDAGYIDVRGFPKDTEVKDPYSGRIFLVPAPLEPAPTPPAASSVP